MWWAVNKQTGRDENRAGSAQRSGETNGRNNKTQSVRRAMKCKKKFIEKETLSQEHATK